MIGKAIAPPAMRPVDVAFINILNIFNYLHCYLQRMVMFVLYKLDLNDKVSYTDSMVLNNKVN